MKKRVLFIFVFITIAALIPVGIFYKNSKYSGRVLGSSINAFYSKKSINVSRPPAKKDDVKDPLIYADYAVLMDDASKYILYQKSANTMVPIASMTKVMTALVSLDLYKLGDVIKAPKEAVAISGSKIGLITDESITVENTLYGMLMNSGNDAAEMLSRSSSVSRDDFIKLMNEKASEIGMKNTLYKDPAGLDDTGHSTAFDMAVLFSYAIKNDTFKTIVGTAEKDISSTDGLITHQLKNTNRLTTQEIPFEGIIGGKTGFTLEAGHALVCAAENNGVRLISVIIKTQSSANNASAQETSKLLSWGFDSFNFFKD